MVRYWLFGEDDILRINARRGEHNRLGFAIPLCLLRYPGWPLAPDEIPPANLVQFVARQLGADAAEVNAYATRDETRREHLQVLYKDYQFRQYGPTESPHLRAHLPTDALPPSRPSLWWNRP